MTRYAKGKYTVQNPDKYVGNHQPTYRSSWEWSFMRFCDTNPHIMKWASEAIKIPYRDPFTNRQTIYVPDFFIQYVDKNSRINTELIEIKPASQTIKERVGKSKNNQFQYAKNQYKWRAAYEWCSRQGIKFRILNENDLFTNGRP
ncbi:head completion protein [bacterium]|nr:head completion protein [bacterium]